MKPSVGQRLRYQFDNWMSHGAPAMMIMLLAASAFIVVCAGALISLVGITQEGSAERLSFFEAAWESLMRTLDAGTMGGDTGAGFRFVMFGVTLGGIFIVSALIGVLNNAIEGKMERLRKGRSRALESNHTVILGWSPQVFTILNELMAANENRRKARIVVLADKDKAEMDDEIRERVTTRGSTRVISRNGSPIDPNDLEIVSPHTAKSIIILPAESEGSDTEAIKTALAVTNSPNRRAEPYHIVTQIRRARSLNALRLIGEKDNIQAIQTDDLIARIVTQTSRQSGLSVVYTELMNFDGDEIYFKYESALEGKTYGEALLAYEDSCAIGVRKAGGGILLNPPIDLRIEKNDRIVALAEDENTIRFSDLGGIRVNEAQIRSVRKPSKPKPERCLILGWNRSGAMIVRELDNYTSKGSQATIVSEDNSGVKKRIEARSGKLKNQKITMVEGDTTDRALLDSLGIEEYDHVIVLANEGLDAQAADAKTLLTLLHLRDIAGKDETPFSIVSEMRDLRNRELAKSAKVDDFIVSEHLVSLMMTQLSEDAELYDVFTELFDPEGAEVYLKPVGEYVTLGEAVNFYTVVEAAKKRNETVIGYRLISEAKDESKSYGVHINPRKSETAIFSAEDKIIVFAED